MIGRLLGIRQRDHRDAAAGFITLLLAMAAHSVLEAARDALFLARLPATLLPWAYLAMTVLTLLAAAFQRRVLFNLPRRLVLSLTLLFGAAVTATFWLASSLRGSAYTLMAFYVWTGLLATLVVVQFWLLAGDVMDFGQAKRAFAVIGGGGLFGATLGAGLASLVLLFFSSRSLPLVAAALLCMAAVSALYFSPRRVRRGPRLSVPPKHTPLRVLSEDPYLRRVLVLVLLGTITVTGVDYVFKATVAREIAAEHLGDFFARYYTVLNGLALAVQLAIAPRLLRSAGLHRTLLLMPTLLVFASLGFAAAGGLAAVLAMKGVDGSLRHSVNRVGTEILYLPLSNELRDRFKAFIEAVGQRGGQALTSIAILGVLALGANEAAIAWGVVGVALCWLLGTVGLEAVYVQLFRKQLKAGTIETHVGAPELDLRSLEALVAGLSSEDDIEVIAALDTFASYDKTNLIPPLILYHPSRTVVLRALELLAIAGRPDALRVAARLLRHADHDVRAAALRLLVEHRSDASILQQALTDASPAVRATALVGLVHTRAIPDDEASREIARLVRAESRDARLALAQGLHLLPAERYEALGMELCELSEPGLSAALARSIASDPDPVHVPVLIRLLADRDARADARRALVAIGERALDALEAALGSSATPRQLRRHLPRTISRFSGRRPVAILERFLAEETDDAIVFKILRGLGRMCADDPKTPVDRPLLQHEARRAVERAVTIAYYRYFVDVARRRLPEVNTSAAELLASALIDHRDRALERAFRLTHILQPAEELEIVYDALRSSDPEMRARGRELLEHVAPEGVREGILALVDDAPIEERLAAAFRFYEPPGCRTLLELVDALAEEPGEERPRQLSSLALGYAACLASLGSDESRVLRSIASYHLAELDALRGDSDATGLARLRLGRERSASGVRA